MFILWSIRSLVQLLTLKGCCNLTSKQECFHHKLELSTFVIVLVFVVRTLIHFPKPELVFPQSTCSCHTYYFINHIFIIVCWFTPKPKFVKIWTNPNWIGGSIVNPNYRMLSNLCMPPSHLTLINFISWLKKHGLHTIATIQSRAQLADDVAWIKSGGSKPQAPTLPSLPKHEARMQDL